jgi:hypothetical protein
VSHELRAPLNATFGFSKVIVEIAVKLRRGERLL